MRLKTLICIVFVVLMLPSCFAGAQKAYIFPVAAEETDKELAVRITSLLKEKLTRTEMFNLFEVEDFNYHFKNEGLVFENLKNSITLKYKESNMKLVVFGYLRKRLYDHELKIVLYSLKSGNILEEFVEYIENPDEVEDLTTDCAINFGLKIRSQKGSNLLLYSAVCPGLGQLFLEDSKFAYRGILYFTGFVYSFVKYISLDSERSTLDWGLFQLREFGGIPTLTIKGNVYDYGTWLWKVKENQADMEFNEKLKKDKKNFMMAIGIIYSLNVFDMLISTKTYYKRSVIEKRVNAGIGFAGNSPVVELKFRF